MKIVVGFTISAFTLCSTNALSPSSRYLRHFGITPGGDAAPGTPSAVDTPRDTPNGDRANGDVSKATTPSTRTGMNGITYMEPIALDDTPAAPSPLGSLARGISSVAAETQTEVAPTKTISTSGTGIAPIPAIATSSPTAEMTFMEPISLDDTGTDEIKAIEMRLAALEGEFKIKQSEIETIEGRLGQLEDIGAKGLSLDARLRALETNREVQTPDSVSKLNAMAPPILIQGGTRKTLSFTSGREERVQFTLFTEGRPIDALIEHWQGPDNTPMFLKVYSDDGVRRPITSVIPTPGSASSISFLNTGSMEFPLEASVQGITPSSGFVGDFTYDLKTPRNIQGGALQTFPCHPMVDAVQVVLETEGLPLSARIELLQGPNNVKQYMEVFSQDGELRPFFAVMETPGNGNTIRVMNTATMEFPLTAWIEPYRIGSGRVEQQQQQQTDFLVDGTVPIIDGKIYTPDGWVQRGY